MASGHMSIGRNIAANYLSQIYVTLVGILMLPFYLRYLGPEAYGLIGFFTMANGWFQLLDMGLTPTFTREVARFRGGATAASTLRGLLHALEAIFVAVALLAAGAAAWLARPIAADWLKVEHLPLHEVTLTVMLMGLILPLRWIAGLYRGAIYGFERQVWLGSFNALVASARFIGVLPLLVYLGATPARFFAFQLAIAVVELLVLMAVTYRLMPRVADGAAFDWGALRSVLRFALATAFAGTVWVLLTQSDKLLLSRMLPLGDYGRFSLAVLVASGVSAIAAPLSQALLPRLSLLAAGGDESGLVALYRRATQAMCVIVAPATLTLAFFAEPILHSWTGDPAVAQQAAPILTLYAIGNGLLAVSAFPYYLQHAFGDLRLHLIGNGLLLVLLIPTIVWATARFGAIGAGIAWAAWNAAYFLLWLPLVHRRLLPGLHGAWLLQDVAAIGLTALVTACALAALGAPALAAGCAIFAVAALASSSMRALARQVAFP